jgi:hypothetical protein
MNAASGTPRFRLALGAMVSVALLVPLAVYGAPAIAKSASSASHQYRSTCGQYGSSGGQYGSACKQYRVTICHRTHSKKHPWHLITVSSKALKAHLKHGDTLPPCSTQPAAKKKHGHGHDNGQHGASSAKHGRK